MIINVKDKRVWIEQTADNGVTLTFIYHPIWDGDLQRYIDNPSYKVIIDK
jgi:hypothetical protein